MAHLGDYDASTVIYGKFTTFRPSTGAAYTLGGTPAISVYKDGSTTQSTTGVTLTADFDSVTGLNHFAIDTSADGTFYAAGSFFQIVITTGTVDSVSVVGAVVGSFTIRKDSSLKPTTAGRTLDVSSGGEAGVDWANVGSPTTTVNLSGTTVKTATDVETDTADIQSRLPAALVSGRIDASVGAMASNTLTAAALATDAVTEIQSGLSTLDAAGVRAAVGLATANLDTQLTAIDDYLDTEVAAIKAKTDNLPSDPADASDIAASFSTVNSTLSTIAGYIDTEVAAILAAVDTEVGAIKAKTDNLPASPAATSDIPSAAAIADAVWDEAIAGHAGAGSTGEALAAAGAAGDPWITALPGSYTAGQAGYIVGTSLDAAISSRASQTSLNTLDDYVDTEVAAIKAKTDLIPASPAAVSDIPTATQNADALLNRDMSAVSDTNSRSPLNALRHIRNKWSVSGTTLTVTKEDDSTSAWTSTLSTNASADPITGSDPA